MRQGARLGGQLGFRRQLLAIPVGRPASAGDVAALKPEDHQVPGARRVTATPFAYEPLSD